MTFEALTPETLDAAAERIFAQEEETPDAEPAPGTGETQDGDGDVPEPGQPQEDDVEDVEAPEEPGEPTEEPAAEGPASASAFHFADLGVTIDEGQARNYALFEKYLQEHPDVAAQIGQTISGVGPGQAPPHTGSPAPQAPPPPELDLEDPRDRWFAEQLTALAQNQQALTRHITQREQALADANARAIVEGVVEAFARDKGLSPEDVIEVRTIAGRIQLPADAHLNPTAAVTNNLEQAYWSIPRFREKILADELARAETSRKRQRKLSAVTGTSGSVSRNTPEPRNPAERKEAMRKAIYEIWQGNAINE
jgi:hypothetical protein